MHQSTILYIHGMGGGGDSRIPSILSGALSARGVRTVVRTYSFHPEEGAAQIASWVEELQPDLVVGESLGANQAACIRGVPHIFVSPSFGAPLYFGNLAFLSFIPGMTRLLDRIYRPKEGDRQVLHFTYANMHPYLSLRKKALVNAPRCGGRDTFFAFFGRHDHYRKWGVVSVRTYRKYFGDTYEIYDGTHFMEEEFIYSLLIPKILETLGLAGTATASGQDKP